MDGSPVVVDANADASAATAQDEVRTRIC